MDNFHIYRGDNGTGGGATGGGGGGTGGGSIITSDGSGGDKGVPPFVDQKEVINWLQQMGKLFGNASYDTKEAKALRRIEMYAMQANVSALALSQVSHIVMACPICPQVYILPYTLCVIWNITPPSV